jgi:hypothetical protein
VGPCGGGGGEVVGTDQDHHHMHQALEAAEEHIKKNIQEIFLANDD